MSIPFPEITSGPEFPKYQNDIYGTATILFQDDKHISGQ